MADRRREIQLERSALGRIITSEEVAGVIAYGKTIVIIADVPAGPRLGTDAILGDHRRVASPFLGVHF